MQVAGDGCSTSCGWEHLAAVGQTGRVTSSRKTCVVHWISRRLLRDEPELHFGNELRTVGGLGAVAGVTSHDPPVVVRATLEGGGLQPVLLAIWLTNSGAVAAWEQVRDGDVTVLIRDALAVNRGERDGAANSSAVSLGHRDANVGRVAVGYGTVVHSSHVVDCIDVGIRADTGTGHLSAHERCG